MALPGTGNVGERWWRGFARMPMAIFAAWIVPALAFQSVLASDLDRLPGRLVDTGTEQLHLTCTGQGSDGAPTVILEAGLAGNHLDWSLVQPLVSIRLRTCSYDRAGAGFSAAASRPRTLDAIVEDLGRMLDAASIDGPLVLVGHSFGGMIATRFMAEHPGRVKGLVLVDSMHPDQFARFEANGVKVGRDPYQVLNRTHPASAAYGLPDRLHRRAMDLASSEKARKTVIGEMRAMPEALASVRLTQSGAVTARVLVHGDLAWNRLYPDGRMERTWALLQADLSRSLGAPAPLFVASAGHQIQLDAPDVVVTAIMEAAGRPQTSIAKDRP